MRQPEQAVQAHTDVGPLGMSFLAVAALPREQQDGTWISSSLHAPMDLKAYDCRGLAQIEGSYLSYQMFI